MGIDSSQMTQATLEKNVQKILVTGAAGYLGGVLRRGLRPDYHLRLSDRLPLSSPPSGGEEFFLARLEDFDSLAETMQGIDSVIHLGGASSEAPWDTILNANIAGTYNVFECARLAGVKRVIFASTHHVVGFYRRNRIIGTADPVRPDTRYGVSKVFGEALGRLYADKYGLSVICQRIGVARPRPPHRRALSNWLSERDYVQLTRRCLEATDVHFRILFAVSASSAGFYDPAAASDIGFTPQDDADDFHVEVFSRNPEAEPLVEGLFQGGTFCAAEFKGNVEDID